MSLFTCPLPLFLLSSSLHCCCALLLHRLLRKARPKRADATRGWSDCGEASARVSAAAKTTYPRVPNRTNGSRTRLPLELEPATFTSRSAFILPSFYLFIFFWSSNSIYLFTVLLTCACYWAVAVSGMRRGLRVAWHARVRGSAQSAQSKLRIQGLCRQIYSLSLFHLQHRTLGADRSKESYTFPATDYESSKKTPKYEIDIYIYTFRSTIDLFFFIFLF